MKMYQRGVDFASIDGNNPPDFAKARAAGAEFAIIRKSFVLHDVTHNVWQLVPDKHYARDAGKARAAGLTVGSYGFFTFAKGGPSAAAQVSALIRAPGEVMRGKDLPYCIDVEFPGRGIVDTGRTQGEAFAFLLELIAEVRKQAGVSPLIYTSHVQWHDSNGLGGPTSIMLDGCPLWIKTPYRLKARQPVDLTFPRLPHAGPAKDDPHDYWRVPTPWQRHGWWLHQYQGDAVGFAGFDMTVDVSHFPVLSAASTDVGKILWAQRRLCVIGAPLRGPLNASGKWDNDTDHAVKAFQMSHNIPATGVIDVSTFASLCW